MDQRKVFGNTFTVAGYPRRWYVISGTPQISQWSSISHLSSIAMVSSFRDRSKAMRWIKRHRDYTQSL